MAAFPDITPELKAAMPQLRGRLLANQSLAELTWFRVGGPAQVLFMPEDEADLAGVVRGVAGRGDYVVFLGAGNITQWAYALPAELKALG